MAETLESLIGKLPRPDENTITLGPVGFVLAQGVYHPASPWSVKEANQFMASHLKLDSQQDAQLNSDLKQENFLSEYEKLPQLQQIFDFKEHQLPSMCSRSRLPRSIQTFTSALDIAQLFCGLLGSAHLSL